MIPLTRPTPTIAFNDAKVFIDDLLGQTLTFVTGSGFKHHNQNSLTMCISLASQKYTLNSAIMLLYISRAGYQRYPELTIQIMTYVYTT